MSFIWKTISGGWKPLCLGLILAAVTATPSFAADFYLVAKEVTKTMPDGANITMWGFTLDRDEDLNTDNNEQATVPGPLLALDHNDATLNIHLRNDLDEPVSILVPGLYTPLSPTSFTDPQGRERVKSFTHETAPNGGIATYSWNNVRAGTFLYHSGTHPAVQVQMGLYGGLRKDAAPLKAYENPNSGDNRFGVYDNEVVLIYSEIDPALHEAVVTGKYGTPDYPSTLDYRPKYFLVNGAPYSAGQAPIQAGSVSERLLIRFINAGLMSHAPAFGNLPHVQEIAEDGNVKPYPREAYSVFLPAGKTKDVIIAPSLENTAPGTYPVYDRRFFLVNNEVSPGGMLVYLELGP